MIECGKWIELTKDIWESLKEGDYFLLLQENNYNETILELFHLNTFLRVCPNNQSTQICDRDYFTINQYSKILLIPKVYDDKESS